MNVDRKIKFRITFFAILFFAFFGWADRTFAVTRNSASCSYADVFSAIAAASAGDTVNVPAGNCTWSSTLTISKSISLIGAGIGNTVITAGADPIISASPPIGALLRVSGFTFNQNGSHRGMTLNSGNNWTPKDLRVDHNRFTNGTTGDGCGIQVYGAWGVIDHNTFDNLDGAFRFDGGGPTPDNGQDDWSNYGNLIYGTANNIYVEDNAITTSGYYMTSDSTYAGRFVLRYNDIYGGGSPHVDIHGNTGYDPSMGGEVYGNNFHVGGRITGHRSGRLAMFFNVGTSGSDYYTYNNDGCPTEAKEIANNSVILNNRVGVSGSLWGYEAYLDASLGKCYSVADDYNHWRDNSSCIYPNTCANITTGAGCGPNLPASCTAGTWFFLTSQSCSNLTGMVGQNPSTPISGTMYQCGGSAYSGNTSKTGYVPATGPNNQWNAVFSPYTYPHPLRNEGGGDTMPPAAPQGLSVT